MSREEVIVTLRLKHITGIIAIILIIAFLSYTYYTSPKESASPTLTPPPRGEVSIDIEVPSTTYKVKDQILISGVVKVNGKPFKSIYIQLYITDSKNSTIWVKQLKTDENGVFKYSYYLDSKHSEGEYTLYAVTLFPERKVDYVKFTVANK